MRVFILYMRLDRLVFLCFMRIVYISFDFFVWCVVVKKSLFKEKMFFYKFCLFLSILTSRNKLESANCELIA